MKYLIGFFLGVLVASAGAKDFVTRNYYGEVQTIRVDDNGYIICSPGPQ